MNLKLVELKALTYINKITFIAENFLLFPCHYIITYFIIRSNTICKWKYQKTWCCCQVHMHHTTANRQIFWPVWIAQKNKYGCYFSSQQLTKKKKNKLTGSFCTVFTLVASLLKKKNMLNMIYWRLYWNTMAIAKLQKGTVAVKLDFWGRKSRTKLNKGQKYIQVCQNNFLSLHDGHTVFCKNSLKPTVPWSSPKRIVSSFIDSVFHGI